VCRERDFTTDDDPVWEHRAGLRSSPLGTQRCFEAAHRRRVVVEAAVVTTEREMNELSYDDDQASTQHHIDKISSALSNELNEVSATALHTLMQCRDYIDELIAVVTEKQKEAEASVRALATKASTAIGQAQGIRQKLEEMRNSI
jgi:hypothetical protein